MTYEILNFVFNQKPGTMLAYADISLGRCVTICSAKLVSNKGKMFLALPTRKVGDKYYPEVLIIDNALRKQITQSMIEKYKNEKEKGESEHEKEAGGSTDIGNASGSLCG